MQRTGEKPEKDADIYQALLKQMQFEQEEMQRLREKNEELDIEHETLRNASCKKIGDVIHADPHPSNTGATAALGRIDSNARLHTHEDTVPSSIAEDQ